MRQVRRAHRACAGCRVSIHRVRMSFIPKRWLPEECVAEDVDLIELVRVPMMCRDPIAKNDLPMLSPEIYANNHATEENAIEQAVFIGDVDEAEPGTTVLDVAKRLHATLGGVDIVAHTTVSHSNDTPKFRVFVPLSVPIVAPSLKEQCKDLRTAIRIRFARVDLPIDKRTHAVAHRYYRPATTPLLQASYGWAHEPGDPLDVRLWSAAGKEWAPPSAAPPASTPRRIRSADKYVDAAIAGVVDDLRGVGKGGRNDTLYHKALRLLEVGVPEADVESALTPVAKQIGLGGREIANTLRSALKKHRGAA